MHDFLDEVKRFSGKSAKLEAICELLKNNDFKTNSRVIIFVRQRKTARFLLDYLKKDKLIESIWHPSLFVGHANGGYDGMMWFGEQDEALNNFHEGSSRLIVSTNVLQVI
jgi:ERCC4-related helicase